MDFTFPCIGITHSCFKEKFGIPRQPGLAPLACAEIELLPPYADRNAFEGLEGCTHVWIQFVFHLNRPASKPEEWKPKVKPPRLGGNKTLGVFATRSPSRPAPIGLSVVRYRGIIERDGKLLVQISGVDLLDGTPVLDIKPYVPYVDCVLDADNTFAAAQPEPIPVDIPPELSAQCNDYKQRTGTDLAKLITQVLQQDPRPQYQKPEPERIYGMKLLDLDVRWCYPLSDNSRRIQLTELLPTQDTNPNP